MTTGIERALQPSVAIWFVSLRLTEESDEMNIDIEVIVHTSRWAPKLSSIRKATVGLLASATYLLKNTSYVTICNRLVAGGHPVSGKYSRDGRTSMRSFAFVASAVGCRSPSL